MNPVGVAVVTGSLIYLAFLLTYFVTVPSSTVDVIDILIPSVFLGLGCGITEYLWQDRLAKQSIKSRKEKPV